MIKKKKRFNNNLPLLIVFQIIYLLLQFFRLIIHFLNILYAILEYLVVDPYK